MAKSGVHVQNSLWLSLGDKSTWVKGAICRIWVEFDYSVTNKGAAYHHWQLLLFASSPWLWLATIGLLACKRVYLYFSSN